MGMGTGSCVIRETTQTGSPWSGHAFLYLSIYQIDRFYLSIYQIDRFYLSKTTELAQFSGQVARRVASPCRLGRSRHRSRRTHSPSSQPSPFGELHSIDSRTHALPCREHSIAGRTRSGRGARTVVVVSAPRTLLMLRLVAPLRTHLCAVPCARRRAYVLYKEGLGSAHSHESPGYQLRHGVPEPPRGTEGGIDQQ